MKKLFATLLVVLVLLPILAVPQPVQAFTRAEIQKELSSLFSELAFLRQKLAELIRRLQSNQSNTLQDDARIYAALTNQTADSIVSLVYHSYSPFQKGPEILEIQKFLNEHSDADLNESGELDTATMEALKVFQEQ